MFLCFPDQLFCSWCLPCDHIQGYCSLHSGWVLWSITLRNCRTHPPASGSAPSHQASLGIASMKRVAPTKVMFLPRAASSKDRSVRVSEGLGPHTLTQDNSEEHPISAPCRDGWASVVICCSPTSSSLFLFSSGITPRVHPNSLPASHRHRWTVSQGTQPGTGKKYLHLTCYLKGCCESQIR